MIFTKEFYVIVTPAVPASDREAANRLARRSECAIFGGSMHYGYTSLKEASIARRSLAGRLSSKRVVEIVQSRIFAKENAVRIQLGHEASIACQCTNASKTPTNPVSAPTLTVYADDDTKVVDGISIPPIERGRSDGLFVGRFTVDSTFSSGIYTCLFEYTVGSDNFIHTRYLEVLPGGDATGVVTSIHEFSRGGESVVVHEAENGDMKADRNPQ